METFFFSQSIINGPYSFGFEFNNKYMKKKKNEKTIQMQHAWLNYRRLYLFICVFCCCLVSFSHCCCKFNVHHELGIIALGTIGKWHTWCKRLLFFFLSLYSAHVLAKVFFLPSTLKMLSLFKWKWFFCL